MTLADELKARTIPSGRTVSDDAVWSILKRVGLLCDLADRVREYRDLNNRSASLEERLAGYDAMFSALYEYDRAVERVAR